MPQELHNQNPHTPSPPNEAYTIGWICAIHVEYVAARAFLDEKHGLPTHVAPNNSSVYTLGRVGPHNVVIGVLAAGEYGIASAANVARDMLNSFPNVRLGLMVGIGGGVPSKRHDVRLGDVVVSVPCEGVGGVLQYGFGSTLQTREFRKDRFFNQPPVLLQVAVRDLAARYEREGHRFDDAVDLVLDRMPRLRKRYQRPDKNSDRLYQSGYLHQLGKHSLCVEGCGTDPSNLITRPERDEERDGPEIHYGLIASADQLMKHALIRDKLSEEQDILCFEMEAAGLMNHFPCLVVRGVADYSDTHKNKAWQGYAAMMAAAYAKDLLSHVPPNTVDADEKIIDFLAGTSEQADRDAGPRNFQNSHATPGWLARSKSLDSLLSTTPIS